MTIDTNFFATTPKGIEPLLTEELRGLGATRVAQTRAGVSFDGTLAIGYRACLWSRLASRVLLPLAAFSAATPEELYEGTRAIPWEDHVPSEGTLAVDCNISQSRINHSHFGALKVKDAVVDRIRDIHGHRPSVDVLRPDVRVNVYIHRDQATVSLDLSGESLHRRGYRQEGMAAPMKENLAAAVLLYAGWPSVASQGGMLLDPMCGSGTLPIEGALLAGDIAPGLLRSYFGFLGWKGHESSVWTDLLQEARKRRSAGLAALPRIGGYDRDPRAITAALANAERAQLHGRVHFECRDVSAFGRPDGASNIPGLVVVNPPYGERLAAGENLQRLYAVLGERLKSSFVHWKAAVFTARPELGKKIGIRARRIHTLYNGALECKLLHFEIDPQWFMHAGPETRNYPVSAALAASGGIDAFVNRVRKNAKHFGKWARRNGISCYRVYDGDIPEYPLTVDLYEKWVYVREDQSVRIRNASAEEARLRQAVAALPELLNVPVEQVVVKSGDKVRSFSGRRSAAKGGFYEVRERGCVFLVNFSDYPDTGLSLDDRAIRLMIREAAAGSHFLNLCTHTATATVQAAMGGALSSVSVIDRPSAYLSWAGRNLAANGLDQTRHECIGTDCLQWLRAQDRRFDLVMIKAPESPRSETSPTHDYLPILQTAAGRLTDDGTLFILGSYAPALDPPCLPGFKAENITPTIIPKDCARHAHVHSCWKLSRS